MTEPVIKIEGLGKRYLIGAARDRNPTLRDVIARAATAPLRRIKHGGFSTGGKVDEIWALRGVDLEVREGETLGIIGRNGAGKSTLLKLLSSVTDPTEGCIDLLGRVGSLLEVGTGFHPELTGRENIYLNGAILGMRRSEIKAKFDEIVEFSEIGKYVDTPVKRYSSGMYVRLAFAVAAYLEPDILLVDEVLAVGDYAFQKKCLGKMSEVAGQGRTVLFVSHNIGAVKKLCSHGLWLDRGGAMMLGPIAEVIRNYLGAGETGSMERIWAEEQRPGDRALRLCRVSVCQPPGLVAEFVDITQPFELAIETEVQQQEREVSLGIRVLSLDGQVILHTAETVEGTPVERSPGQWVSTFTVPPYALNVGTYALSVAAEIPYKRYIFSEDGVLTWTVAGTSPGMSRYPPGYWTGFMGPCIGAWRTRRVQSQVPGA